MKLRKKNKTMKPSSKPSKPQKNKTMKSSSKPSKSQKNKTITIHKRRVKKRGVTIRGGGEQTVPLNIDYLLKGFEEEDSEVDSINKKTMGIAAAAITGCAIVVAAVLAPD